MPPKKPANRKPLRRVIVRTYSAGVHYGHLVRRKGKEVTLINSRRIWSWVGAASLSQVAVDGVGAGSKIALPVTIELTEAIEVIDCSPKAVAVIEGLSPWRV